MITWIIILGLLAVFAIVVAVQPSQFAIKRSLHMPLPPEKIFPEVNELRRWEAWNPWGRLDPSAQMTYEGPPAGAGASYTWSGNQKIGAGRLTITASQPGEFVRFRLDFLKPMAATNLAEFTFKPQAGGTLVTWCMNGRNNFIGKLFGLLIGCEKMIGGQFEKGLANLQQAASQV